MCTPQPRCVDEEAVALALVDHFGVARHQLYARRAARPGHRGGDAPQVVHRQPFFEDEARRQVQRLRPAHRQVVDRAVHGQAADVAAGEEQRADHKRVGSEGQPRPVDIQHGLVVERGQRWIVEERHEQVLDQVGGEPPAAAMPQHDLRVVAQRQGADEAGEGGLVGQGVFQWIVGRSSGETT